MRITFPSSYTNEHIKYLTDDIWNDVCPFIESQSDKGFGYEVFNRLLIAGQADKFYFADVWCWDLVDSKIVEIL